MATERPRTHTRRKILIGAGTLGLAAVLKVITGRDHSEPTSAAKTGSGTASKPDGQATQTGARTNTNSTRNELDPSAGEAVIILNTTLQSLDGKEITVKELAAKSPLFLVAWSSLDNSVSKSWIPKINTEVYPQFANSNVQFLAVETWSTLPNLKKALAGNPDHLKGLSFPMVVAGGPDHSGTILGHTGQAVLIEKGGGNMQEFDSRNFDQIAPAIAKLAASGN